MNEETAAPEESSSSSSSSSSFSHMDEGQYTSTTTTASSPSLGRNKSWSSRATADPPSLPAANNKQKRRRKLSLPSLFAPAHHLNKAASVSGSKDKVDFDGEELKEAEQERAEAFEQWQRPQHQNRDEIERVEKEDEKRQAKEKEKEQERPLISHLLRRKHTKLKTTAELIQGRDSGGTEGEPAACLADFPDELFLYILSYLELQELGTIALVCRKLLVLSEDDSLWRGFCEHRWPNKTLAGAPSSSASSLGGGPSPSPYNDGNVRTSWKRVYLYKSCVNKTWMAPTYRPGVTTLTGHKADVLKVRFNERLIVSGSKDRSIKIWNVHTGQCLRTLQGHRGKVYCVRFDDSKVVSCSQDQTIKVWDIETGKCTRTLRGHSDKVWCVRFDEENIVSGGFDHTLKIWDLHSKKCIRTLTGHTHYIYDLQFDKEKVVSCAAHPDNTIRIWDQRKGRCRNVLSGHSHYVYCLQYDHEKIVLPLFFSFADVPLLPLLACSSLVFIIPFCLVHSSLSSLLFSSRVV